MEQPRSAEDRAASEKVDGVELRASVDDVRDEPSSIALEHGVAEKSISAQAREETTDPPSVQRPAYILPLIVVSQLAGTSLWFAGNAVLDDLIDDWGEDDNINISSSARGYLTSVVQLGFIAGTLMSALLNLPDRFPPTRLFMLCSLAGALFNAIIPFWKSLGGLISLRLLTGICLAGIYPVGMKVASDWFQNGLGRALGWLVGALAVGSALPFLLNRLPQPWEALLWETSILASIGGLAVGFLVPTGPYHKAGTRMDPSIVWTLFEDAEFRAASFGYFCHMWELYAFWVWCPTVWEQYLSTPQGDSVSWDENSVTFAVLAVGGLGCVLGGLLSDWYGSAVVAFGALFTSGTLCLLSPALFLAPPAVMLLAYLLWGLTVVADSPQFSSLVASTAPATSKGSALTIVNCIGFAITIGSIQLLDVPISEQFLFILLAPGPILGLWNMIILLPSFNRK